MKLIKNILLTLFALSILSYLITSRFFRINTVKDLNKEVSLTSMMLYGCISIFFLFLFIYTLYRIYKSQSNSYIISNINNFIVTYYFLPLREFDLYLKHYLNKRFNFNYATHTASLYKYIYKDVHKNNFIETNNLFLIRNKYFLIYLFFTIIPKIMLTIIFILEIIYTQQIYYFYWCMPLLLLPLLFRYFKYMTQTLYELHLERLEIDLNILDIIPATPDNLIPIISIQEYMIRVIKYHLTNAINPYKDIVLSLAYFKNLPQEYKNKKINSNKIVDQYMPHLRLCEMLYVILWIFNELETKYNKWFNLIIFGGYCIGWTYILISNISEPLLYQIFNLLQTINMPDNPFS